MMLTPEQLAGFRARLEKERARLQATIEDLEDTVEQMGAYEETERGTLGNHQADVGTELYVQEEMISLEQNEQELLYRVERALERLDEGVYGQCERCGQPIPVERLEAIPYATFCVSCQSIIERERAVTAGRSPSS